MIFDEPDCITDSGGVIFQPPENLLCNICAYPVVAVEMPYSFLLAVAQRLSCIMEKKRKPYLKVSIGICNAP